MVGVIDYDRNSKLYDRRHGRLLEDDEIERLIRAAALAPPARILDLAAGTGRVSIPFSNQGFEVVALDRLAGMTRECREKDVAKRVVSVLGDAVSLPFTNCSFDGIVVARLLYLIPDWKGLLREALGVLRGPE